MRAQPWRKTAASRRRTLSRSCLADAIDDAQLKHGIATADVEPLLFAFSGNDPTALSQASLQGYGGTIHQHGVGLRIAGHTQFVRDVFEEVMADGDRG